MRDERKPLRFASRWPGARVQSAQRIEAVDRHHVGNGVIDRVRVGFMLVRRAERDDRRIYRLARTGTAVRGSLQSQTIHDGLRAIMMVLPVMRGAVIFVRVVVRIADLRRVRMATRFGRAIHRSRKRRRNEKQ